MVDGLDEVDVDTRASIIDELGQLCRRISKSTLISTCRFGAIDSGIAAATTLTAFPLT